MNAKSAYLLLYNSLLAGGWAFVLFQVCRQLSDGAGLRGVFEATIVPLKIAQTAAVLEIVHAATGFVRSPVFTTTAQVFSRLWELWGIVNVAPSATSTGKLELGSTGLQFNYATLLMAWSLSEILRYSMYALKEAGLTPPYALLWLRYSAFTVLYPIGVGSELTMAWLALPTIREQRVWSVSLPNWANFGFDYHLTCWLILALYLPGLPMLYGYMLTQRRKVLGPKAKPKHS